MALCTDISNGRRDVFSIWQGSRNGGVEAPLFFDHSAGAEERSGTDAGWWSGDGRHPALVKMFWRSWVSSSGELPETGVMEANQTTADIGWADSRRAGLDTVLTAERGSAPAGAGTSPTTNLHQSSRMK
jgi:hypothetical protein